MRGIPKRSWGQGRRTLRIFRNVLAVIAKIATGTVLMAGTGRRESFQEDTKRGEVKMVTTGMDAVEMTVADMMEVDAISEVGMQEDRRRITEVMLQE